MNYNNKYNICNVVGGAKGQKITLWQNLTQLVVVLMPKDISNLCGITDMSDPGGNGSLTLTLVYTKVPFLLTIKTKSFSCKCYCMILDINI